jgi:hypothetical protein
VIELGRGWGIYRSVRAGGLGSCDRWTAVARRRSPLLLPFAGSTWLDGSGGTGGDAASRRGTMISIAQTSGAVVMAPRAATANRTEIVRSQNVNVKLAIDAAPRVKMFASHAAPVKS